MHHTELVAFTFLTVLYYACSALCTSYEEPAKTSSLSWHVAPAWCGLVYCTSLYCSGFTATCCNYNIATDVWMCRSTACIVVPDNNTTIAVDKAQCNYLIRTTRANTAILKLYIILWITLLTPGCSIYSHPGHHRSCLVIWLHQQWISCTQL